MHSTLTPPAWAARRLGPASGVLGTGLLFAGLVTASSTAGDTSPAESPSAVAAAFAANADRIRGGVFVALAGLALLLWFLADLRRRILAAEGDRGILHAVAFGGGLVGAAGATVYLAILVAASNDAIAGNGEVAASLLVLSWEYGGVLAPAYAALVGATSLAIIRHRLLPLRFAWLAWLGLPLALGLAVAGFLGGALVMTSLLWLLLVATAFLLTPSPPTSALARASSTEAVAVAR